MVLNKGRCAWVTSVGLAVFMALVGCSGSTEVDSTATPSTPTPSVSATPTPSPTPTPSTISERAAVDAVIAYTGMVDTLAADPQSDMQQLATVARGQALAQTQYDIAFYRGNGWRQIGRSRLEFVGTTPGSDATQWLVTMCVDVSEVDVVDTTGQSVVQADRSPRVLSSFTVDQDHQKYDWFVTLEATTETC